MVADLSTLIGIQNRRTRRTEEALQRAMIAKAKADRATEAAIAQFNALEASHAQRRDSRIRAVLEAPPSASSLAQIHLSYEVGEDEMGESAARILACQKLAAEAGLAVQAAREAHNLEQKREKKLEEAHRRQNRRLDALKDVSAEMELER